MVPAMNAQFLPLSMKTETTLSVYGQLGNHAVVRIPGRRLPGLILQADTVAGFLAQLQEAQACLRSGRAQRTDAELDMLIDVLQQWYALIESRLADAGEALWKKRGRRGLSRFRHTRGKSDLIPSVPFS